MDYAFKDDTASMEAPIFSLATKPDLTQWKWESKDGKRRMEVTPSVLGRATIHDKDVLIYITSQMTEALNRERSDTSSRKVRFTVHDYLMTTNRHTSGREYETFQVALRRLSGTRIYTNIETGDVRIKHDFGIIDSWEIVEKSAVDDRMIAVEIELSEWLYNAIQAKEVLTLHPDYFRLRKPTERRIYELARKHCGHQAEWTIGLSLLHEKSGSRASLYEFHETVKAMAESDHMPDYRIHVSKEARVADVKVKFYTRDMARYARSQAKRLG
ncbi:MAG: replication initiator protein A [Telluria sp.]